MIIPKTMVAIVLVIGLIFAREQTSLKPTTLFAQITSNGGFGNLTSPFITTAVFTTLITMKPSKPFSATTSGKPTEMMQPATDQPHELGERPGVAMTTAGTLIDDQSSLDDSSTIGTASLAFDPFSENKLQSLNSTRPQEPINEDQTTVIPIFTTPHVTSTSRPRPTTSKSEMTEMSKPPGPPAWPIFVVSTPRPSPTTIQTTQMVTQDTESSVTTPRPSQPGLLLENEADSNQNNFMQSGTSSSSTGNPTSSTSGASTSLPIIFPSSTILSSNNQNNYFPSSTIQTSQDTSLSTASGMSTTPESSTSGVESTTASEGSGATTSIFGFLIDQNESSTASSMTSSSGMSSGSSFGTSDPGSIQISTGGFTPNPDSPNESNVQPGSGSSSSIFGMATTGASMSTESSMTSGFTSSGTDSSDSNSGLSNLESGLLSSGSMSDGANSGSFSAGQSTTESMMSGLVSGGSVINNPGSSGSDSISSSTFGSSSGSSSSSEVMTQGSSPSSGSISSNHPSGFSESSHNTPISTSQASASASSTIFDGSSSDSSHSQGFPTTESSSSNSELPNFPSSSSSTTSASQSSTGSSNLITDMSISSSGSLTTSGISMSNPSSSSNPTDGSTMSTVTSNPEDQTTTVFSGAAPMGKMKAFTFKGLPTAPTLHVDLLFKQIGNSTLQMMYKIRTDPKDQTTINRFCFMKSQPQLYLIKGFSHCRKIVGQTRIQAQLIAVLDKPNEDVVEITKMRFSDLEGNCLVILQESIAKRGRAVMAQNETRFASLLRFLRRISKQESEITSSVSNGGCPASTARLQTPTLSIERSFQELFLANFDILSFADDFDDAFPPDRPDEIESSSVSPSPITPTTASESFPELSSTQESLGVSVGAKKQFYFRNEPIGEGLNVSISFEQMEKELRMYCSIQTDPSASSVIQRFCSMDIKPKLYLVRGFTDCKAIMDEAVISAQLISVLNKPNENAVEKANLKFNDLNGNCLAVLQEAEAKVTSKADQDGAFGPLLRFFGSFGRSNEDTDKCGDEEIGSGARLLMMDAQLKRSFLPLTLSDFIVLSTAAPFLTTIAAPAIIQPSLSVPSSLSIVKPPIISGNPSTLSYNPLSTFPNLQLPNWSITLLYVGLGGLSILFILGILGSRIPFVTGIFNSISSTFSRREEEEDSFLTESVYDSIEKFDNADENVYYYYDYYDTDYYRH